MSDIPNTGGPAFPSGIAGPEYGDKAGEPMNEGMSLRDYLAARAFQAAMTGASGLGNVSKDERTQMLDVVAGICYEGADAMLRERERKPE